MKKREREQKREMEFLSDHILRQYLFYAGSSSDDPKGVCHCYSELSDFSSRRAEFGRLAVLGCTENLPEPLDGVTV